MKHNLLNKFLSLTLLTLGGAILNPAWGETTDNLLSEDFSDITSGNNTGTSGSSTSWDGNTNFPTVTRAYQAGGAIKIGANSNPGSITSKSLTVNAGTLTVAFDVKGWSSVEGSIKVTVGSEDKTISYTKTMSQGFESKTVDFTVSSGTTTVKLETTAKRAFLDNITITNTYSSGSPTACATPTFSPVAGEVAYGTEVSINCATDDATIYYTTDGSTPSSSSSTEYTSPITVTTAQTIKAIAIDETGGGLEDSDVATADYTIAAPTTPTFSPAAGAVYYGTEITLTSDEGTTIYYTTDGSTPDNESSEYDPAEKPTITASCTIKAIAYNAGGSVSSVGSAAYILKNPDAPTFSLDEGMVSKGASLELSTSEGASIRYTTDGTTPSASVGTVYSSPITINSNQTIKAIAYDPNSNVSSVVTKAYTVFEGEVVTFTAGTDKGLSEASGKADEVKKSGISISCTNAAFALSEYRMYKDSETTISTSNGLIKKIEFTGTSGYKISNLSANVGTLTTQDYDGTWTGSTTSVEFTASAQARATLIKVYVARTSAPSFSVAEGEYSEAKSVTITSATDDADIYYTTDGSTPTSSSTAYSSAISVTETMTLKAIAIYDNVESPVSSVTYTMNRPTAPTFDVAEGEFEAAFDLHLSTETDGATIYYTTDGSTPTTSSATYSTKVVIPAATTTIKAIAVKNGLTSDVSTATYTYDTRTTPTFSLSSTEVDLYVNIGGSVTLTTNHDGTITATSSNSTNLPIVYNSSTGECTFTPAQAGEYTITFSATGSTTYKDAEAVATVNVTKKPTTMTIETAFDDGKDLKTATEGLIEGTVKYSGSALSPQPTITYTSSDPSVATIDEDGIVTFIKVGSTTLTASFAGNDEYAACEETYNLDLIDTTPQETEVTLSFNNSLYGTSYTGSNAAGNGPFEGTIENVTVKVAQGSGSNLYVNDTETRIYTGTITITAPTGYVMTKIEITTGSNWSVTASPGSLSSTTWTGSESEVVFSASARSDFKSATITLAETVTIGSAGYTTYVAKHDISFPAEVTAFIATATSASTVTLTSKESVSEGTPVVVKGEAGTYALPTITTTPESVSGNLLLASDGSVEGDGSSIYALGVGKTGESIGKVGFYLVDEDVVIPAGKAYLDLSGSPAKEFLTFDFGENADGIQSISNSFSKEEGIYNLSGQRLNKVQKGINIVNGKKVLY